MITTDKSVLFALGDIHGDTGPLFNFTRKHRDAVLVQVGDVGLGFQHPKKHASVYGHLDEELGNSGSVLILMRGNHDDPAYWDDNWAGEQGYENILMARDYEVMKLNGADCMMVGGAVSVDRMDRLPGRSYWVREGVVPPPPTLPEVELLFCHSAPEGAPPFTMSAIQGWLNVDRELRTDLEQERKVLRHVTEMTRPTRLVYGHFHEHYDHALMLRGGVECRATCLNVNELICLTKPFTGGIA